MFTFNHFNFNVLDLARSVQFYHDALGLEPVRTKDAADGSFRLVFLGDGHSPFQLELTGLRDRTQLAIWSVQTGLANGEVKL